MTVPLPDSASEFVVRLVRTSVSRMGSASNDLPQDGFSESVRGTDAVCRSPYKQDSNHSCKMSELCHIHTVLEQYYTLNCTYG